MYLVKVISAEFDNMQRRVVKFFRGGRSDVATAIEASAFGVDSNPVKDMIAIYSPTSINGNEVIIGYINKNQLAQPGEVRLYSTDMSGSQKFYTWLKNDGTYEMGGSTDNAIRYSALNAILQNYFTALNASISAGVVSGGGVYTPPAAPNLSPAKINEIKTS